MIWVISNPDRLSQTARRYLVQGDSEIFISVISCAEIACAVEREKIELNMHWKKWFRYYMNLNAWNSYDINLKIIEEAYSIPEPFHRDPADRIIVATARMNDCHIITADLKILYYPHVDTIW